MTSMQNARWRVERDWIDNPVNMKKCGQVGMYTYKEMKKIVKPAFDIEHAAPRDGKRRWNIIMNLEIGQTWTYFNMSGKSTYTRID